METRWALSSLLLPLLAGAVIAGTRGAGEDPGDSEKIRGTWAVLSGEKAGQKAPEEVVSKGRMTFADATFTWTMDGRDSSGSFTLDSGKSPAQIVLTLGTKKLAGIYRLAGDELKICLGSGDEPPAEFASEAGSRTVLLVLKRTRP